MVYHPAGRYVKHSYESSIVSQTYHLSSGLLLFAVSRFSVCFMYGLEFYLHSKIMSKSDEIFQTHTCLVMSLGARVSKYAPHLHYKQVQTQPQNT
jgi:hypothetical protein